METCTGEQNWPYSRTLRYASVLEMLDMIKLYITKNILRTFRKVECQSICSAEAVITYIVEKYPFWVFYYFAQSLVFLGIIFLVLTYPFKIPKYIPQMPLH